MSLPTGAPMTGRTLYDKLADEGGLQPLIDAFYDAVESDPRYERLYRLHLRGHGVAHSRREQFDFLSGFLGGPRLYVERHGHAQLRDIHAHVPIDAELRDLWLDCMGRAVAAAGISPALGETLMRHFSRAAEMVRNLPAALESPS